MSARSCVLAGDRAIPSFHRRDIVPERIARSRTRTKQAAMPVAQIGEIVIILATVAAKCVQRTARATLQQLTRK